jgi:hypothetical protein
LCNASQSLKQKDAADRVCESRREFMNHFMNVLDGFSSILDFRITNRRSYIKRTHGFASDRARLKRDIATVGEDLRKTAQEQYGKQAGSRSGY